MKYPVKTGAFFKKTIIIILFFDNLDLKLKYDFIKMFSMIMIINLWPSY